MNNFMLRFFYELFLEICICALVNIALTDFDDFSPGLQWIISCIVLGGIFVYLCWLISLFCCKGPYLDGFYDKITAMSYFWSTRSINLKYNASEKLKKIQLERAKCHRLRFQRDVQNTFKKTAEQVGTEATFDCEVAQSRRLSTRPLISNK